MLWFSSILLLVLAQLDSITNVSVGTFSIRRGVNQANSFRAVIITMSQSEMPLNAFSVDINAHSVPGSTFYHLPKLANHIFMPIEHYINPPNVGYPDV